MIGNAVCTAVFASSPLSDTVQSLGLLSIAVLVVAGIANLLTRWSVWLLNRLCRYCRESLQPSNGENSAIRGIDRKAEELRATVESLRREEESLVQHHSYGRCATEEVIRAKSLRVQAEIVLLRHEAMPKSWAEICGEAHAAR